MTSIDFSKMWKSAKKQPARPKGPPTAQPSLPSPQSSDSTEPTGNITSSDSIITSLVEKLKTGDEFGGVFTVRDVWPAEPNNLFYIPNFITPEEETELLKHIYDQPSDRWINLMRRRLQNWGGYPHPSGWQPEPLPEFLTALCQRLHSQGFFPAQPNHVLINEYQPGEGIMPHKDGPLYYPRVVILSLQGPSMLEFRPQLKSPPETTILAQRRSVLVFQGKLYTSYFHGIEERTSDNITEIVANRSFLDESEVSDGKVHRTAARVSLTVRIVPFVLEAK